MNIRRAGAALKHERGAMACAAPLAAGKCAQGGRSAALKQEPAGAPPFRRKIMKRKTRTAPGPHHRKTGSRRPQRLRPRMAVPGIPGATAYGGRILRGKDAATTRRCCRQCPVAVSFLPPCHLSSRLRRQRQEAAKRTTERIDGYQRAMRARRWPSPWRRPPPWPECS